MKLTVPFYGPVVANGVHLEDEDDQQIFTDCLTLEDWEADFFHHLDPDKRYRMSIVLEEIYE